jgi:hypothetical protein
MILIKKDIILIKDIMFKSRMKEIMLTHMQSVIEYHQVHGNAG